MCLGVHVNACASGVLRVEAQTKARSLEGAIDLAVVAFIASVHLRLCQSRRGVRLSEKKVPRFGAVCVLLYVCACDRRHECAIICQ